MLTLADILAQQDFKLRLLTGDDQALRRRIAGAHNSEMTRPAEFLPPEWLLLTLGMTLGEGTEQQRGLIASLDDAGISALGFGVGVAFSQVPDPLLDEARRRDFPIFEIPYATPYREIIGFVNRSLLSNDFRLVHRSLSMQNYLMDALRDQEPTKELVQRLAQLLDSTILLFDDHGAVEAASHEASVEQIWAEVREHGATSVRRGLVGRAPILSIPIDAPDRPRRWLVVVSQGRSLPAELATSVIRSTERLLELITLSQRAADLEDQARRGELLTAAVQHLGEQERNEIGARLVGYGIDFVLPGRILLVRAAASHDIEPDRLRAPVEHALRAAEVPYLTALRGTDLLVLVQVADERLRPLAESLVAASGGHGNVGAGRAASAAQHLRDSLRDAETAIIELAHEDKGAVRLFEELRFSGWLLGTAPADGLQAAVGEVLSPLDDQEDLYRTLVAYLRSGARVTAAAEALNLHENSLRYRLSRIEKLLGRSLRDFDTVVDLYLATMARET